MKKLLNKQIIVFAFLFFVLSGGPVQASDSKNFRDPILENVERVFIEVHYRAYHVNEEDIPEGLRKEDIEKMMLEFYKKRFSSKDCDSMMQNRNRYSCDDQPVMLVPERELSNYHLNRNTSFATAKELKDKGTLKITLKIVITGNTEYMDPPLSDPIFSYLLVRDRPNSDEIPMYHKVGSPVALPLNQKFLRSPKRTLADRLRSAMIAEIH